MLYSYWIVRFVPNVARGEFTNVGIVCGRDDGDWNVRFDSHAVKTRGAFSADLSELREWSLWFEKRVNSRESTFAVEPASRAWLESMRMRQANVIQFSSENVIDVESAKQASDLLFPHLVERPRRRRTARTRRQLRSDLRELLVHEVGFEVDVDLFIQPEAQVGLQVGQFDFMRDGSSATTLSNVWSFNQADLGPVRKEIQASNYLVSRFRDEGATVRFSKNQTYDLAGDTPIEVIYDPPTSGPGDVPRWTAYQSALEAWSHESVGMLTVDAFTESALQLTNV